MLEAKTSSGSVVFFQTGSAASAFEAQGLDDRVTVQLTGLSTSIGDFLKDVAGQARAAVEASAPNSIEIEVGFLIGAEGGIIVTKGKAEAHLTITAKWD